METAPILSIRDLAVAFESPDGPLEAVSGVSFDVFANEVLCIVGESGSGKSVSVLATVGLLPANARIAGGRILFRERDVRALPAHELRALRGGGIGMIFQDPMSALNPVIRVGDQIAEMIRLHRSDLGRAEIRRRVLSLMTDVKMPNPEARFLAYPHELSGGMRQRVVIAMAMANHPDLLIADEPTTALDVTIQAQVLALLREMRRSRGSSMVLITHDLGVVAETADRVLVMYCGRVVETAPVEGIFNDPRHPYTVGLLASRLPVDADLPDAYAIPGQPPSPAQRPAGCAFHPRCGLSRGREPCRTREPKLDPTGPGRAAACHFADETPAWRAAAFPSLRAAALSEAPP